MTGTIELSEYVIDAIANAVVKKMQEPCEDVISKQPKMGRWIYDKNIENWRCSECGETPKTLGYCGTADFMAEHFKYCNHCGAKIIKSQESEE